METWVIGFDMPRGAMLHTSGASITNVVDEAMKFRSQASAPTYLEQHRNTIDSLGSGPIPDRLRS
jgi:hypothetical protein